jgi:stage V sporulation protein D (sporulation-specific penicillin-binding protein)
MGMSVEEIEQLMVNLQVDVSGNGSKVVQQSPKPGTKVKEGSTIRLYLSDE